MGAVPEPTLLFSRFSFQWEQNREIRSKARLLIPICADERKAGPKPGH